MYAEGGLIEGSGVPVRIKPVGECQRGHLLYSINRAGPEHVWSLADLMADRSLIACPNVVASDD